MRLLLVFSLLFIQSVYASSAMYVGGDIKIPMRTDTSFTEGNIIHHLELGTKVEFIKATDRGWSQIRYNDKTGWIISRYLTMRIPIGSTVEGLTRRIEHLDRIVKSERNNIKHYKNELNAAEKTINNQELKISKFNSQILETNKLAVKVEELSHSNDILTKELHQEKEINLSMHTTNFLIISSTIALFLGGLAGVLMGRSGGRKGDLYKL